MYEYGDVIYDECYGGEVKITKAADGCWVYFDTGEWYADGIVSYGVAADDIFWHWYEENDIGIDASDDTIQRLLNTQFDIAKEINKWKVREHKKYLLDQEAEALAEYIVEDMEIERK